MANLRINELDEIGEISDTDVLAIDTDSQTYKVKVSDLASYIGSPQKIYGIERSLTTEATSWTRTDDAVGLTANATHDGTAVTNDFDAIYPWSGIITVNLSNSGVVNAKLGDLNFKWDGSNGEVMTYIPEFYWDRSQDGSKEYIKISNKPFINSKFSDAFYVGRFPTTSGTHSYSDSFPQVSTNIGTFRSQATTKGSKWQQMDWHYFLLEMLYLVEYADYNSQSKLGNGVSSIRYTANDKALVAENNVNRIIIASDNTAYEVGTAINIGTSQGSTNICANRLITLKESYSSGDVSGTAIYFDGSAVDIAVNNVLWGGCQKGGQLNSLGMKSGCLNNNSRHSVIYRGIEDIFGNVFQWVDGINIKDNVCYMCYDASQYQSDKFTSPYSAVGYTNANSNNWAKKMGYDYNNPMVGIPIEVQSDGAKYITDYYYQNSGNRVARVGGNFDHGANVGLFYWYLSVTSSTSVISIGSRLLKKI